MVQSQVTQLWQKSDFVVRKKAAAEGAVAWYIKQFVVARAARSTFGINVLRVYSPMDLVSQERFYLSETSLDGVRRIPGYFDSLVEKVSAPTGRCVTLCGADRNKNTVVQSAKGFKSSYRRFFDRRPATLESFTCDVLACDSKVVWCEDTDGALISQFSVF